MYAVDGLPTGEEASIFNCGVADRPSWQVLAAKYGISSGWTGDYGSPEQALAAIVREVSRRGLPANLRAGDPPAPRIAA
jgi:hypothetical protein